MKMLPEKIRSVEKQFWISHHNNMPSHTSTLLRDFLPKNSTNVIDLAGYSPDMVPCNFFLLPKFKLPFRGRYSESVEAIKENSQNTFKHD